MSKGVTRRAFLGGAIALGATGLVAGRRGAAPHRPPAGRAAQPPVQTPPARPEEDPRVEAVIALSRDQDGVAHVERVAFVGPDGAATGTLSLSPTEAKALLLTLVLGDFTDFQRRGLRIGGRKFVFIRDDAEGTVIHAIRPGEFLTLRAAPNLVVIATSGAGMVHNRAVEAVYQFLHGRQAQPALNA